MKRPNPDRYRIDPAIITADWRAFNEGVPPARRRPRTKRVSIASLRPEIKALWNAGATQTDIARAFGQSAVPGGSGCIDPTPQPIGLRPYSAIPGESPEHRAYRRFPIDAHKPGRG